jgi:3-deoxy-manno-octulosonate cytidylyltransferase (CMP-KDO synthetase)
MASTRFPGKPLARIAGLPMIEHVWRRVRRCPMISRVLIATCDKEIARAAAAFGAQAVMTSPSHQRATDRVAEIARSRKETIILMVQGDEPLITTRMLEQALLPMREDPKVQCVNLMAPIDDERDFSDPNTIKVVTDERGDALYFSREPIPTTARVNFRDLRVFKQVCVIPFRRDALLAFERLEPTALEKAESIDMLRFVGHGIPVRMIRTKERTQSVDTPSDLRRAERLMRSDPAFAQYRREAFR